MDRTFVGRIEAGVAKPSLDTLLALSIALGADLSVRFYPGTGPRLTDRHQARMIEAVLSQLDRVWIPHVEVPVRRPARGVIDAVFERPTDRLFVIAEAYSALSRLEQQIRWSAEKAASLESSGLVRDGVDWTASRLLMLRSTESTRALAHSFEATLRAAYPAPTAEAVSSLRDGRPWPGHAIIWVRIESDRVEVLGSPPRGIRVGR